MASLTVAIGHPAQLGKLHPLADLVYHERLWIRESEAVPLEFLAEGRVGGPARKEVLEGAVQVHQGLLKTVAWCFRDPRVCGLEVRKLARLGVIPNRVPAMGPCHGSLFQRKIP